MTFPLPYAPQTPPPSQRPAWFPVLVVWCGVTLASGLVAVAARSVDDGGVPHPDAWDSRVVDLAEYVEDERGLDFDHPVFVDFLDAKAYTTAARGEVAEQTDADIEASQRDLGRLRALGLVSGDIDLLDAQGDVADAGTLAFYSPLDERVRVRGTKLTPGLRVTLVHELTHALQDQHFDLERLEDMETAGEAFAFRALVEGDAVRIEQAFLAEKLSAKERAAAEKEATPGAATEPGKDDPLDEVPDGLVALFGSPYAFGPPFAAALDSTGGNDEVDNAFDEPPTNEEHVFDLLTYFADDEATDVEELATPAGAEVLDGGDFGAVSWYLVLAAQISPFEAMKATDGWGGDTYLATVLDGEVCVRARFVGETKRDTDEMVAALNKWERIMPGEQAVDRATEGSAAAVDVRTCDPGPDTAAPRNSPLDALQVPSLRGYLVADALNVVGPDEARCYAAKVIGGLSFAQIADPDGKVFKAADFQTRLQRALRACR